VACYVAWSSSAIKSCSQIDRARRAAADVEIDRDDFVDRAHHRVAFEHAAAGAPVRIIGANVTGASNYWYVLTTSPIRAIKDSLANRLRMQRMACPVITTFWISTRNFG
jgi:hypothetical protein